MNTARIWKLNLKLIGFVCLCLALPGAALAVPETNSPAENSISNETLRAYLQLQEQIRDAQLAIERTRRESETAALKNAEAMTSRLQAIEQSIAAQRARDLEAMQSTTRFIEAMQSTGRFMLIVLSVFAGAGFLGIVLTAFFQWRTVNRLTEFAAAPPAARGLLPAVTALPAADNRLMDSGLLGAVERLERRILELEQSFHPPLNEHTVEKNGGHGSRPEALSSEVAAQIKALVDTGQTLVNQDKVQEAIDSFDEALALDPDNTDALVKKGAALEKIRKLPEAIECYDHAIAVDSSMTIAYLYKGGLYNRMERFSEAVECYEQALRTQEKRAA
jgi:tetratricopeptide (TPR) repeat protein